MSAPDAAAEQKVLRQYAKLYPVLMQLVESLQHLEPVGTFVDQAEFARIDGNVRVRYKARPTQVVIEEQGKRFVLRWEDIS